MSGGISPAITSEISEEVAGIFFTRRNMIYFINTMRPREITASYLRNFIFGVEDGLVSTVGLLSGIAAVNVPRETIILTGMVLIFVEAFSMAMGSFLSESSAEEYEERTNGDSKNIFRRSFFDGLIMFFSYFAAGLIPLLPYIVTSGDAALPISVGCSLSALLLLGVLSGRISRVSIARSALRMTIIGGLAISVGILVGSAIGR